MEFTSGAPVYLQITQDIKQKIASGEWPPGTRAPTVRELSALFRVNPNTAQRAFSELEREGLLRSERTSGRFVTQNENFIKNVRREMAEGCVSAFLSRMESIGYAPGDAAALAVKKARYGKGEENE